MLTAEEKRLLNAARAQMDAEQREAFDSLSDEEKKELLAGAVKEAKRAYASSESDDSLKSEFQRARSKSFWTFVREHGDKGIVEAGVAWLLLQMIGSKAGCLTLIVLIIVGIVILMNMR